MAPFPLVATALTVTLLLATPEPLRAQTRDRLSKRLEQGGLVNLNVRNLVVSKVVERLENSTGNRVRFVDQFGRDDQKVLLSKISLDLDLGTFWEAVRQIEKETGYKFKSVKSGVLELTQDPFKFGHGEPAGAELVCGSFLVIPEVDTFLKKAQIKIRPEPWIQGARVTDYEVALTLTGGEQMTFKPRSPSPERTLTGDIKLPLEPELKRKVKNARKLELEASLEIPQGLEKMKTPPLGELLPKTSRRGATAVRILDFAFDESRAGSDERRLNARFEVHGSRLPQNSARLVGPKGETIEPRIWSYSELENHQEVRASYYSASFGKKLDRWKLVLDVPVLETKKLGKIAALEKEPGKAGLSEIQVTRTRVADKLLTVHVAVSGAEIRPASILLVEGGKNIEPTGHFSSTDRKKQTVHLVYELSTARPSAASMELVAQVPIKKETIEIKDPARLRGHPISLGVADISVLDASKHHDDDSGTVLRVRLEARGTSLDTEEIHLLDPAGKPVQRSMWSSSDMNDYQSVTLDFDSTAVGRDLDRCRLQLVVPRKVVPYTLKATLRDVRLRP